MKKQIKKSNKKIVKKESKEIKGLFQLLVKALGTLITGIFKIIYIIVYNVNNAFARVFIKLPRIAKVLLIYTLVVITSLYIIKPRTIVKYKEVEITKEVAIAEETNEEVSEEKEMEQLEKVEKEEVKETKCLFKMDIECKIYNKGLEMGLTKEQAVLAIAISKSETGWWKSNLYKNNNNFGGMYDSKNNTFYKYNTNEDGLTAFIKMLRDVYFKKGLVTPKQIQPIYAPINAKNDKEDLNKNWYRVVNDFYNQYLETIK